MIHCDIKPENILFTNKCTNQVKIIDFGSACYTNQIRWPYIQSRFYRAPEVHFLIQIIYGINGYDTQIDIWSLGCLCAELYLGLPLFPGNDQYD